MLLLPLAVSLLLAAQVQCWSSLDHGIREPIESVHSFRESRILVQTTKQSLYSLTPAAQTIRLESAELAESPIRLMQIGKTPKFAACSVRKTNVVECSLLEIDGDSVRKLETGNFRLETEKANFAIFDFLRAPHLCLSQSLTNDHDATVSLPMFSCRTLQFDSAVDDKPNLFGFLQIPRSGLGLKSSESAVRVSGSPSCRANDLQIDFIGHFADAFNMYFVSSETTRSYTSPNSPTLHQIGLYRMCKDELNLMRKLVKVRLSWPDQSGPPPIKLIAISSTQFGLLSPQNILHSYSLAKVNEAIFRARQNCYKFGNVTRGLCILKADEQCHSIKSWNESVFECSRCAPDQYELPYPLEAKSPVEPISQIRIGRSDAVAFAENGVLVSLEVTESKTRVSVIRMDSSFKKSIENSSVLLPEPVHPRILFDQNSVVLVGPTRVHRISLLEPAAVNHVKRESSSDNLIKKVMPSTVPVNGTRLIIDLLHPTSDRLNVMVDQNPCDRVQFIHRTRISCHSRPINVDKATSNTISVNLTIIDEETPGQTEIIHTWKLLAKIPTISDLSPKKCIGSGGATLSLWGENLDVGWRTHINIGPDTPCNIISVSSTQIKCRIEHTNMAADQLSVGIFQDVFVSFDNNTRIVLASAIFVVPDPLIDEISLNDQNGLGHVLEVKGAYLDAVQTLAVRLGNEKKFDHCPTVLRRSAVVGDVVRFAPAVPSECLADQPLNVTIHLDAHRVLHRIGPQQKRAESIEKPRFPQLSSSFAVTDGSNGSRLCLAAANNGLRFVKSIVWDCVECRIHSRNPVCCHRNSSQPKCPRLGVYVYTDDSARRFPQQISPTLIIVGTLVIVSAICAITCLIAFLMLRAPPSSECECCECSGEIVMSSSCSSTVQRFEDGFCSECEHRNIVQLFDSFFSQPPPLLTQSDSLLLDFANRAFEPQTLCSMSHSLSDPLISLSYALVMRLDFVRNLETFLELSNQLPYQFISDVLTLEWLANTLIHQSNGVDALRILVDTQSIIEKSPSDQTIYARCGRNLFPIQIDHQTTLQQLSLHFQRHLGGGGGSIKLMGIDGQLVDLDSANDGLVRDLLVAKSHLFPVVLVNNNQQKQNYYQTLDNNDTGQNYSTGGGHSPLIAFLALLISVRNIGYTDVVQTAEEMLRSTVARVFNQLGFTKSDLSRFVLAKEAADALVQHTMRFCALENVHDRVQCIAKMCRTSLGLFPFKYCLQKHNHPLAQLSKRWYHYSIQHILNHINLNQIDCADQQQQQQQQLYHELDNSPPSINR